MVVSLLPGNGPTGVETHFNQIMEFATGKGINTQFVNPNNRHWLWRKIPNGIGFILKMFNIELALLWNRWVASSRLRTELKTVVIRNLNNEVVFYAQDPLSALACLSVSAERNCRVVAVSHYNISEADEMATKGLIAKDGMMWKELMRVEKAALAKVSKVIFVSKYMSNIVNQRLPVLQSVKQRVIPNFTPSIRGEGVSNIHSDLIAIGTLEPRKNQSYLLRVLLECKKLGYKYSLTIVGDGPDRVQLENMAKNLGIAEQVHFLGFLSEASELISSHRLFVHSSVMESFGIVILEAFARGKPIVAAAVGGIPEIVTEGENGLFWNLDDPQGGAKILMTLLNNPTLLNRMSVQAKQTFDNKFNPAFIAKTWLEAILGNE